MTPHRRWTQADITDLRERVGAGTPPAKIAEAAARSVEDVARMIGRLHLDRVRYG